MPTLVSQPSRSQMRAAYPPRAREEGIEGDVRMKILVSSTGQVTSVRLLRPAGNGFDEAARNLVRRFRFRAARKGGRAVAVWIPWTYKFRLSS
jgi:protein TonB